MLERNAQHIDAVQRLPPRVISMADANQINRRAFGYQRIYGTAWPGIEWKSRIGDHCHAASRKSLATFGPRGGIARTGIHGLGLKRTSHLGEQPEERSAGSSESQLEAASSLSGSRRFYFRIAMLLTSFAINFRAVGGLDGLQKRGIIKLTQDFNIRHHAMAADHARKVFRPWEKRDFFIEGAGLFKGLARLITVPLHFLRPSDHQAEIRR